MSTRPDATSAPGAGQVAVVTGGSSGIGEVTARHLHDLGFTVHAAARRTERMAGLAALGIHTHSLDVTVDESMRAFVDEVIATSGRIDVLVNNAGYGSLGAIEDVALDEARRQFEVNVFGLARMAQLVLPGMRSRGSGCIINVGSVAAYVWQPFTGWYHATKGAVLALTHALRAETALFDIRVVLIEPAMIRTEWAALAIDSLSTASRSSAYEPLAGQVADGLAALHHAPVISTPEVVAKAIGRAATARRPRSRYLVGNGARPMVLLSRVLPDRAWDAMTTTGLRLGARLPRRRT